MNNCTPKSENAQIKDGSAVITVRTDGGERVADWRKKKDVHYCRKFGGYGIQSDALDPITAAGCTVLKLTLDTGEVHTMLWAEFLKWSIPADLGRGKQNFIPVRNFRHSALRKTTPRFNNDPLPIQLSFA